MQEDRHLSEEEHAPQVVGRRSAERRSSRHGSRSRRGVSTRSDSGRRTSARSARHARTARSVEVQRPVRRVEGNRRGATARVLGGVALLAIVLGTIGYGGYRFLTHEPTVDPAATVPGEPVHVVIQPGSTTSEIARQLADLGVVENALMFRWEVRKADVDGDLRAGEYDLATGMPYSVVIERLLAGPRLVYVDVTIPEGFTVRQVAERLATRAGLPADEITALVTGGASQFVAEHPYLEGAHEGSLEGFLFPATYSIEASTTSHQVVEMMLDQFDRQMATVDLSYAESKGLDLNDVVVIASILEREAQLPEEFPLVSSVIYNRLGRPMLLQLCATVMYEMPPGTTQLTNADLELESPYNTYKHEGLPVGPISNPGLAALQAAAKPAETDYLYYVLTGKDGSQTFTSTYDEFLAAKRKAATTLGD